jgi:hypothetical protein
VAISTRINEPIKLNQFLNLYRQANFVQDKWQDDPKRLQTMLDHTQLMVSLWDGTKLIGVARCLTDFEDSCYLSEQLIKTIRLYLGDRVSLILRADHAAIGFYKRIGLPRVDDLYRLNRKVGGQ